MPALNGAGIRAAFTTRHGGFSAAPFASLNLSFLAGDDPDLVRANRARVLGTLGANAESWTSAMQVHDADVARVGPAELGSGATEPDTVIPGTDALWTDRPGAALAVLTADCAPILLADPSRRRIGVVHAGWRGMVAGVIGNAVAAVEAAPTTVAFIGPSIGPCCYEVGEEVASAARETLGPEVVRERPGTRPHLDLWRGAALALRAAGVHDVRPSALCTRCEPHRFYSHRAGDDARQGLVAVLVDGMEDGRANGRRRD
ncbi:MAG TPA: peptidoglycan editing factor PgeF [Actinomycetota bacterium]